MISNEAVEAAAKATFGHANLGAPWDEAAPDWKDAYRASVRAGLEAAAPLIRAEAPSVGNGVSINDIAHLCIHGMAICAPCDHVPSSWKVQP